MHVPRQLAVFILVFLFAYPAPAQEYKDWSRAYTQARFDYLHGAYDVALDLTNQAIMLAKKEVDAGGLGAMPAKLYNTRGELFEKLNRRGEAEQDFLRAKELAEAVHPISEAEMRVILANLADVLQRRGSVELAEQYALRVFAGNDWD